MLLCRPAATRRAQPPILAALLPPPHAALPPSCLAGATTFWIRRPCSWPRPSRCSSTSWCAPACAQQAEIWLRVHGGKEREVVDESAEALHEHNLLLGLQSGCHSRQCNSMPCAKQQRALLTCSSTTSSSPGRNIRRTRPSARLEPPMLLSSHAAAARHGMLTLPAPAPHACGFHALSLQTNDHDLVLMTKHQLAEIIAKVGLAGALSLARAKAPLACWQKVCCLSAWPCATGMLAAACHGLLTLACHGLLAVRHSCNGPKTFAPRGQPQLVGVWTSWN